MAAGALWLGSVVSQAQAPAETPSEPHRAKSNAAVFGSDAGWVLNFVKPDKTADFEAYASGQNNVNLTLTSALGQP